ncbi:MAG TPA: bifunctional 3-deoxy-7-phosphoheptulonate synthase/chorismate mutase [Acidimicrobiia bacterium]|jgi:chorismate mutase/prephenate dehydratase|nr:bifunctional 3-deoxy-7-phosphoheptulonate synthase/chorismate mutase [Acidimicrobiia bacterium]
MYGILDSADNPEAQNQTGQLDDLRSEVDRIDDGILSLLAERRQVARQIAAEKHRAERPFRDDTREEALLVERLAAAGNYELDADLVSRVWEQIMADSLRVQFEYVQNSVNGRRDSVVIAIQGVAGSNSHQAALTLTPNMSEREFVSCSRFTDAITAVKDGRANIAVLPIENTTSGAIAEVYDLLLDSKVSIVGEAKLLVNHCLVGVEGASVSDLKTILGHPQAVAQCSNFLAGLNGVEVIYADDTALSARRIAEMSNPVVAALASEEAARIYGLQVLASGINNRKSNYTRFVAVAAEPATVDPQVPAKTSLVLSVSNEPGSLAEVLNAFRAEGIPLVKLESRPTVNNAWQELFYMDFEGNLGDERVQRTLEVVRRHTMYLRVLGSYPSRDLRPHRRPSPKPERVISVSTPGPQTMVKSSSDSPYRLAGRKDGQPETLVDINGVVIGGPELVVIAGPCAVESIDQVMKTAKAVKEAGGKLLRGGCFKPRTSPYSFQGLGWEGLDMLAEAGRVYGLPIVTEVTAPEHVEKMAEKADVIQIGTRNMQNFALLSEVGRSQRPVLLKRGMSASIDEFLQAAEYVLAGGNQRVILCERGIRTFETSSRNTLDVTAVPVLRRRSHLPVIVDPSHAAGDRDLVAPLAMAGAAIGAHGLMVEIHPDPDTALSDGPQSLTLDGFDDLMRNLSERSL